MVLEAWHIAALVGAGCIGGFINVMAGGGSIITVPVMIFLGVPGPIANGTNRIAILAQNITAVSTFFRSGVSHFRLSLSLAACAIPGAVAGALVGATLNPEVFNTVLAVVMVAVLILMQTGGAKAVTAESTPPKNLLYGHLLMIAAGFWGGFIQIGMGFILMPILNRVMGLDLVTTNVHKVFIVGLYTLAALLVFATTSEIMWLVGGILAVGNSLGGYLGAKMTLKRGDVLIKRVLLVAITAMIIKLLFFT